MYALTFATVNRYSASERKKIPQWVILEICP